jgi:hypothetical protein
MPKARFTVNAFFLGLVEAEFEATSSFYDFFSHRQFRAMTPVRENQSVGQRCL